MGIGSLDDSSVHVSNRAGKVAYLAIGILGVLFGAATLAGGGVPEGLVFTLLVGAPSLLVVARVPRIGLTSSEQEVVVRNLGRTYRVSRDELTTIRVGDGSHSTGATSALIVERENAESITAMGTASYSRAKVERMLSRISH